MKPNDRFYKGFRQVSENLNLDKSFVLADSIEFKKASVISLETVGNVLQLKLDEDVASKNISAVDPSVLESKPTTIPGDLLISPKTYISVDDNYLYVWISKLKKWKRILLSDWSQE